MTNVQLHSAVVAKVHALRGKLMKAEDYHQLMRTNNLIGSLRQWYPDLPPGGGIFELEVALLKEFQDQFEPIYLYYGFEYRQILKRIFMRFEVERIKRALRALTTHDEVVHPPMFRSDMLSNVDEDKFNRATNYDQLADAMLYPPYRKAILSMKEIENHPLFHVEMMLDKEYFRGLLEVKDKLEPIDEEIMLEAVGIQVDMLNINWIRRAKATFGISPEEIFNYSLSRGKRLGIAMQRKLSYMSLAELDAWIAQSPYAEVFDGNPLGQDARIERLLYQTLRAFEKKYPMSIAPVITYLHEIEYQMRDIDRIVEARDYHFDVSQELLGKQVGAWR